MQGVLLTIFTRFLGKDLLHLSLKVEMKLLFRVIRLNSVRYRITLDFFLKLLISHKRVTHTTDTAKKYTHL